MFGHYYWSVSYRIENTTTKSIWFGTVLCQSTRARVSDDSLEITPFRAFKNIDKIEIVRSCKRMDISGRMSSKFHTSFDPKNFKIEVLLPVTTQSVVGNGYREFSLPQSK